MSVWGNDSEAICRDPTCYRGRIGGWNYQFKDGPCQSKECKWPRQYLDSGRWITIPADLDAVKKKWVETRYLPARPHFTDTPSEPIRDAGKEAFKLRGGLRGRS